MTVGSASLDLQETEFTINHLRISALTNGDSAQRPLLLLHGWLDNAGSFRRMMRGLDGFRCVALDFPGHGRSEHYSAGVTYHFLDLVTFIDDAVSCIGGPIDIIGHSLGGAAATLFAAASPEKIRTLTLIDTLGPLTDTVANTAIRLREHLQTRRAHRPITKKFGTLEDAVRYRVGSSVIPTSPLAASEIVLRGTQPSDKGFEWSHDARLKWPSAYRMTEEQLYVVIEQIKCPVLLIRANPGIGLSSDQWNGRISRIKNVKHHLIDGSHHIHIDEDAKVSQWIRHFLSDNSVDQ